jgi:glucose-1-phosphate cytidylyltransferase
MKCVILAGGRGTRIAEESSVRPKPMVHIGGRPIIWHIMKCYSHFGINDFIICLGYKGFVIKEYFANYFLHQSDVTFDIANNRIDYHEVRTEPWRITLVDTGIETMTGGRLKKLRSYLEPDQAFCMTYGDGLADINIKAEIEFHRTNGRKATIACVRPPARFGHVSMDGNNILGFNEKPLTEGGLINGGFFVLEPSVLDYISGDETVWEQEPLEGLAADGELAAWTHDSFWQPMDTLRDKLSLDQLWQSGTAPWCLWDDSSNASV